MSKILVTGCSGFIGGNLCRKLNEINANYLGVDNLSFGSLANLELSKMSFEHKDFKDIPVEKLDQFDILIHLATSNIIYAMTEPIETVKNNSVETVKLFQRFKGKIIYTSTASVYGNAVHIPTLEGDEIKLSNGYDTSKHLAELFLRQRGNFTTLRLSNVYGRFQNATSPYCGVLGKFVDNYLSGKPFIFNGKGDATRDYTYVEDVVDAILLAVEQLPCETEINIATGVETSVLSLAEMIDINHEVILATERKIDSVKRRCLNVSLAEKLLSWKPKTDIKAGIRKTIEIKRG